MNGVIATTIPQGCRIVSPSLPAPFAGGVDGHRLAVQPRALGGADAQERRGSGRPLRAPRRAAFPPRARSCCASSSIDPATQFGSLPHDLGALVRREAAHRARSLCRRRERSLGLVRAATGTMSIDRAVVRVHDLLLAGGPAPLAGDVHLHQASPLVAPNPAWRSTVIPSRTHVTHARVFGHAVDDDEAVEAHAHPAVDTARLAATRQARRRRCPRREGVRATLSPS